MTSFITEDFLLQSKFARLLYHGYAKGLPIIDYHCHLSPCDIAKDTRFENISKVWLAGDHYKWRAMRTLGIDEKFITGNAPDDMKFDRWAYAVPYTMRNPLYHWTHLELLRYFTVNQQLNETSARDIYNRSNSILQQPAYSTRGLLKQMKVEVICTTDDPIDSLEYHQKVRQDNLSILLLPTFRPDKSYAVENPEKYKSYVQTLSAVSGLKIESLDDLLAALEKRIDYFQAAGGRLADHGLEHFYPRNGVVTRPGDLFKTVLKGQHINQYEADSLKCHVLTALCKMYHRRGWIQQFHIGALRNTNDRMLAKLGPDTGFDSIGDFPQSRSMAQFFNDLDSTDQLAKTVIYNLNPGDNEVVATMIGNYNDGSVRGKMQFGSAWWFLDQKDGMEKQVNTLSNMGLLSCFIGMLTDSRSFLSYPRHEYFRRILCNLIGNDVENGELPADEKWLGQMVSDICYFNARTYFNFAGNAKTNDPKA